MRRIAPEVANKARALYLEGILRPDIALRLGINKRTVWTLTKDLPRPDTDMSRGRGLARAKKR